MACIITYENKQYTQKEFEQYFKEHFTEFVDEFINIQPDVILPIGTSGSGKSTFIKSLPPENLVVIEPDVMRVEFTGDMNDKSKDKEIYVEAANRAIQAIKQGKQVVFDTTNLTKDKRLPFIEAIKKTIPTANIQYKLMELNPELAKQRIKAQLARGENRAAVSDTTIDRHAESFKQMLEDIKSEPITEYKDLGSKQDTEGFKNYINNQELQFKALNESSKDFVNNINSNYGAQVIIKDGDIYKIQLPSTLVDKYEQVEKEQIPSFIEYEKRINSYIIDDLKDELGITNEQEFFTSRYTGTNFEKYNSDVKFQFDEEGMSRFDGNANTIFLNLKELKDISNRTGIDFNKVVGIMSQHEMGHAMTTFSYEKGNGVLAKTMQGFLDKAIEYHNNTQRFEDIIRQDIVMGSIPYPLTSIYEFTADTFGNPYFQEWLKKIPYNEHESIFDKIINFIRELIGIGKKDSLYDAVISAIGSDRMAEENYFHSQRISEESYTPVATNFGTPSAIHINPSKVINSLPQEAQDRIMDEFIQNLSVVNRDYNSLNKQFPGMTKSGLKNVIESFNEVKTNSEKINAMMNGLLTFSSMAAEIKNQAVEVASIKDDDNAKLQGLVMLQHAARMFKFVEPYATSVIVEIEKNTNKEVIDAINNITYPGYSGRDTTNFKRQLEGIFNIPSMINEMCAKELPPALVSILGEESEENEGTQNTLKLIDEKIVSYQKLYDESTTDVDKKLYQKRIKEWQDRLDMLPSKDVFKQIFIGKNGFVDSKYWQMLFTAGVENYHPLVQAMANKIFLANAKMRQEYMNDEDDIQKWQDEFFKVTGAKGRNTVDIMQEYLGQDLELIDDIEENEDGTLKYTTIKQHALLNWYAPEYIQQYDKLEKTKDFYEKLLYTSKADEDREKYKPLLDKSRKDFYDFISKNAQRKFKQDVYDMWAMQDTPIHYTENGEQKETTLRKEKSDIFEAINNAEIELQSAGDPEVIKKIEDYIEELYRQLKRLSSTTTTGKELEISKVAQNMIKEKNRVGKMIMTGQGKERYENQTKSILRRWKDGKITKEQKDKELSNLNFVEIDNEYFNELKRLTNEANDIITKIINKTDENGNPLYGTLLNENEKSLIKEGYEKIKNIVAGYRDMEGVIDGIKFTEANPEGVKMIKQIQETIYKTQQIIDKISDISPNEKREIRQLEMLEKSENISTEDKKELDKLRNKRFSKNKVYTENQEDLKKYKDLKDKISSMTEGEESSYYIEMIEQQKKKIAQSLKKSILNKLVNSGTYAEIGGKTYFRTEENGEYVWWVKQNGKTKQAFTTSDFAEEQIAKDIADTQAQKEIKNSEWWMNNHYKIELINKKGEVYQEKDIPIYIWRKTSPTNKEYINTKPSYRFQTYQIKEEYTNPESGFITRRIPFPNEGLFINKRYTDLKNATDEKSKIVFKTLENLRERYNKYQEKYDEMHYMGDVLPSMSKTGQELTVEGTNAFLGKGGIKKTLRNLLAADLSKQSEDEQFQRGGGISKQFARNKEIPVRFAGRMDISKQTKNIFASVLGFGLNAHNYTTLNGLKNLMEGIELSLKDRPVTEYGRRLRKLNGMNLFKTIGRFLTETKEEKEIRELKEKEAEANGSEYVQKNLKGGESNLVKHLKHLIDTYIYQETKTPFNLDIGDKQIDMHKVGQTFKSFTSKMIFSLNFFTSLKNSVSAGIQGFIDSGTWYSKEDFANGMKDATTYTMSGDMTKDYLKYGNKSLTGHLLRYFNVMHGGVSNEYGKLTQWNAMLDKGTVLSVAKNFSEYSIQVAQFFGLSRANPVEVDGKLVPFHEAYTLDDDGKLKLKDGANVTDAQIRSLIGKISYVNRTINGAYREEEKGSIQKNWLGSIGMFLNGFIPTGIRNRYGNEFYSQQTDKFEQGRWTQFTKLMKELVEYKGNLGKVWHTMEDDEKARVLKFLKFFSMEICMLIMANVLLPDEPKQLEQNTAFKNYLLSELIAVKSETETFTPLPTMGFDEISRRIKNPFPALQMVSNIGKLINDTGLYVLGSDSAYFKNTTYHDGFHDEGMPKMIADAMRIGPIKGMWWQSKFSEDQYRKVMMSQIIR